MKLEFTPFGTLSMEEADQLINKEWFHDLLENFPNKDRHFHLFPICRAALKANVSIEEAEPLILKALEKVGGRTEQPNEIKEVFNWCAVNNLTKGKTGEQSEANKRPIFSEYDEIKSEKIL